MKKILNIFKYIIVPYHCVIKYCFLLISPFVLFYYFFEPFVFDDTKHFLDNFGSSFGLNGIIAWALFLFFFISPAVYYLKSRGICSKDGNFNMNDMVFFQYKFFGIKNYTFRSLSLDLLFVPLTFNILSAIITSPLIWS